MDKSGGWKGEEQKWEDAEQGMGVGDGTEGGKDAGMSQMVGYTSACSSV